MSEKMTAEQFEEFFSKLPEGTIDRAKLARTLGVELPIDPIADQLSKVKIVKHTPKVTKRNPSPVESEYVSVPSLKLSKDSGTKAFWVKTSVVREVAEKLVAFCDDNDL